MPLNNGRGQLFIVSAASGVGKTTIIRSILADGPALRYSVSCTTRSPRPGEIDGKDYHFLTKQEFRDGIRAGRFLEWAEVHGEYYGTDGNQLEEWLAAGADVLLDIDVQGARQVRSSHPEARTIFILPPSREVLAKRLQDRGTESSEQLARRLAAAQREIQEGIWYEFTIVNDVLEEAIADFKAILRACRCERAVQAHHFMMYLLSKIPE